MHLLNRNLECDKPLLDPHQPHSLQQLPHPLPRQVFPPNDGPQRPLFVTCAVEYPGGVGLGVVAGAFFDGVDGLAGEALLQLPNLLLHPLPQ